MILSGKDIKDLRKSFDEFLESAGGNLDGDNELYGNFFDTIEAKEQEINRLKQWINDLQSGMYVNCVYCGHRYGPEESTPASMADVLKEHIEHCPEHPMSKSKQEIEQKDAALEQARTKFKLIPYLDTVTRPESILRTAEEGIAIINKALGGDRGNE